MLNVKPTQLTNDGTDELFREAGKRKQLASKITNVFSTADKMTRSIVSSATSTTLTVKQKFDNVRSMQKYNEEKEAEYEKVAKAMEEERQRRLEEQKVAKGK